MLVTAGHESTSNLIGNALHALLRHPDQLRWLRSVPDAMPAAMDELLRYDPPVQLTAREAVLPLLIGGQRVLAGQRVIPLWGAANRDPAVFVAPAVLDLKRVDARAHLSFGAGRHRCLGASLARTEAELAIGALLERYGELSLVEPPIWRRNFSFRGLQRLVVSGEPA